MIVMIEAQRGEDEYVIGFFTHGSIFEYTWARIKFAEGWKLSVYDLEGAILLH